MHERSQKMFIEDILEAMQRIESYIHDLTFETFAENNMAVDAVIRNLEILGEAARNISEDVKEEYPDIPWKRMIGMRNIAAHEYFGVDLGIVWQIVTKNLPETKPKIEAIGHRLDEQ